MLDIRNIPPQAGGNKPKSMIDKAKQLEDFLFREKIGFEEAKALLEIINEAYKKDPANTAAAPVTESHSERCR